jgi:hypothetical protein
MYRAHFFYDNNFMQKRSISYLPRVGDTIRFEGDKYGEVTEIIWCLDEDWPEGQRVNIRTESNWFHTEKS